jgi:hypothetical protein
MVYSVVFIPTNARGTCMEATLERLYLETTSNASSRKVVVLIAREIQAYFESGINKWYFAIIFCAFSVPVRE